MSPILCIFETGVIHLSITVRGLRILPMKGHCYFLFLGNLHYTALKLLQVFWEGRMGIQPPFSARAWSQELSSHWAWQAPRPPNPRAQSCPARILIQRTTMLLLGCSAQPAFLIQSPASSSHA